MTQRKRNMERAADCGKSRGKIPTPSSAKARCNACLARRVNVAFGNVVLKRLGGQVDTFRAMGWQLLIGSVPLSVLTAAMEDWSSINWDMRLTISVLSLAVLGTALPSVLWFELLRRAPLTQLNGFTFLTPIFGLAIGALWFDERVTGLQVGGIGLSVVGIYLLSRSLRSLEPGRSAG